MKSITYGMIEEKFVLQGSERISYGIAAYSDAEENGTATIVASVQDVSFDYIQLGKLIDLCNHLELDPIHLKDVMEDFLANLYTV